MKKSRLMVVCCLALMVMLFTSTQALAYTYTVINETQEPIKVQYAYMTGGWHYFNDGKSIPPGGRATVHDDGVKCLTDFGVQYKDIWKDKIWQGCGNKTFTVKIKEEIKITH